MKLSLGEIHSTVVKEKVFGGLRLSESLYPPHLKTPEHSHRQVCFSLILRGASTQKVGQRIRQRTPKTILFYPIDESHSEVFGSRRSRIFSIEISSEWLERMRTAQRLQTQSAVFEGGLMGWLASRLYREFNSSDEFAMLAIEGLALELIAESCRRKPETFTVKQPPWLVSAKEIIRAEFPEHLSLGRIANQVGVHPVYLASTFHKTYGCTLGEYVRKLRIDFAIRELTSSNTPLSQIAVISGFANQAHFTKVFKEQTGITPGEYRKVSNS